MSGWAPVSKETQDWYNRVGGNATQEAQGGGTLGAVSDLSPEVATATPNPALAPRPIPTAPGSVTTPTPGVIKGPYQNVTPAAVAAQRTKTWNPIGDATRWLWHKTMEELERYNRVYQTFINDPLTGANLILAAPVARQKDESLSEYVRFAWGQRDDVSLGQSEMARREEYNEKPDAFKDPIHNLEAFKDRLNPITVDPVTGEQSRKVNWQSGALDFVSTIGTDPLTYVGGPTRAVIRGATAPRIVDDIAKSQISWLTTRGSISTSRVNKLLEEGKFDPVLRRGVEISDPKVAAEYIKSLNLMPDDPDTFAYLMSQIDDVERMKDLFTLALRPNSDEALQATNRLRSQYGADLAYYASRHAGHDPLFAEQLRQSGDLMLGPQTQELLKAVVEKGDFANPEALNNAMAFSQGIHKLATEFPGGSLGRAPTIGRTVEGLKFRGVGVRRVGVGGAARRAAPISDDPVVSVYKPFKWHPAIWYIEKPAGLVEPGSPTAWGEIDASMRQLDRLTKGQFTTRGVDKAGQETPSMAEEITDEWFRASTLRDPETARGAVAAKLNDYALRKLLSMHHKNLEPEQIQMLVDAASKKSAMVRREINDKGWVSALDDHGGLGVIRYPALQRATPNAVPMYDFRALDRQIKRVDELSFRSLALSGMMGSTTAVDAVMGIWKINVLLRLGYTIRNLEEASLSMAASGNLGNVLSQVGPERVGKWMEATARAGGRQIDRVAVAGGLLDKPQALFDQIQAWDGMLAATNSSAEDMVKLLTGRKREIRKLAKSSDPADQEMARRLTDALVELTAKDVTHHVNDVPNVFGQPAVWKPAKGRALSTSKSRARAQANGQHVHQVTSYGHTLDLVGGPPPPGTFNAKMIADAKAGDAHAVQSLSDAAWKQGYGRVVLPDAPQWGGRQVIVNQAAMAKGARKAAVENRLRGLINEADEVATGAPAATVGKPSKFAMKRASSQARRRRERPAPLAVNPDYEKNLNEAMISGGLKEYVEALSMRRLALDDQIDFLSNRYAGALKRTRVTAPAKTVGRGFQQGKDTATPISPRGNVYPEKAAAYGGDSGGWYETAIGGNTSYSTLAGDNYQGLMAGGAMLNKEVSPDNPRYYEAWAGILNLHFRDHQSGIIDPVVERILNGESFDDILEWATKSADGYQWAHGIGITKTTKTLARPDIKAADMAHADTVEEAVASLMLAVKLYMPEGALRDAFLTGKEITQETVRAATQGQNLHPIRGLLIPTSAEAWAARTAAEKWQTAPAAAMKVLGSIPEASFARHPLFAAEFHRERRTLLGLAEEAKVAKGAQGEDVRLTVAEFNRIDKQARQRAMRTTEKTLYTITRRSTVGGNAAIRTMSPFVSAYENVLQRWSRFVMADPTIIPRYANYAEKFNQGMVVVDEHGNEIEHAKDWTKDSMLVLPGLKDLRMVGAVARAADALAEKTHLPLKFTEAVDLLAEKTHVPIKSTDVAFQGSPLNPGVGPLVVLGLAEVVRDRPNLETFVKWAMPYGVPENRWDVFLSTAGKRLHSMHEDSTQYTNAFSKAALIAQYRYEHLGGPEPDLVELKKVTKSIFLLRAMVAMGAPFATTFTNDRDFYAGKLREYQDAAVVEALGAGRSEAEGLDEGEARFYLDFPDAGMLTESLSRNPSGIRAAPGAVANAKRYEGEIAGASGTNKSPEVAGFIANYSLPEGAEFSQGAYQWERQNGPLGSTQPFRQVGEPAVQATEGHIREGWRVYRSFVDRTEAELQANGWDPQSDQFQAVMKEMRGAAVEANAGNEAWLNEYNNADTSKYERRAQAFRDLLDDTRFSRDHEQDALIQSIRLFLERRTEMQGILYQLAERKKAGEKVFVTLGAEANVDLQTAYDGEISRMKLESPEFAAWHGRFFPNDVPEAKAP